MLGWGAAALNLAFIGLLTGYVFGAQPAFHNQSAWRLRVNAGEHSLYWAVVAVGAFSVALFGLLAFISGERRGLLRGVMFLSGATNLILGWLVRTAFEVD